MDKVNEIAKELMRRIPTSKFVIDQTQCYVLPYGSAWLIYTYTFNGKFPNPVSVDNGNIKLAAIYQPNSALLYYIDVSDFDIDRAEIKSSKCKSWVSFAEYIDQLNNELNEPLFQNPLITTLPHIDDEMRQIIYRCSRWLAFGKDWVKCHTIAVRENTLDYIAELKAKETIVEQYITEHLSELRAEATIMTEAKRRLDNKVVLNGWEQALADVINGDDRRLSVMFAKNCYRFAIMMKPASLRALATGGGLPSILLNDHTIADIRKAGLDQGQYVMLNIENIESVSYRGETLYEKSQYAQK